MGREQGHKYRFFGLRSLLENRFPQPQLSRILLVYCKIIPGKLGFAQMDDLVGPINEHINLSPRQGIIPLNFHELCLVYTPLMPNAAFTWLTCIIQTFSKAYPLQAP
jgi:hypothetical protein